MSVALLSFIKDSDDDSFRNIDIGILLVEPEGTVPSSSLHLRPASLKIIMEGEVVMANIQDLPKAMCILFGLAYAMHLNYPRSMKFTFQFIQQVFLELGPSELKPKLDIEKPACDDVKKSLVCIISFQECIVSVDYIYQQHRL